MRWHKFALCLTGMSAIVLFLHPIVCWDALPAWRIVFDCAMAASSLNAARKHAAVIGAHRSSPTVRILARENGGPWVDLGLVPRHRFEGFTDVYAATRTMALGRVTHYEFKCENARPN